MSPEEISHIIRQTFYIAIELAAPFLIVALVIGLLISLFQSATGLQELSLSFVPKILALAVLITFLFPWMMKILTKFTSDLLIHQWSKVVT